MKRMENRKPRLSRRDAERIEFARQQRRDANEFSSTVWQWLRSGRMRGEKFRREYPLGPYTLDFVCVRLNLDIEIDGKEHLTAAGLIHDSRRDAYLQDLGFTVLRIPGFRVPQDADSVIKDIDTVVCGLQSRM